MTDKEALALELAYQPCKRGDVGRAVSMLQEWLCLSGLSVAVDGSFGPATEKAVAGWLGLRFPKGITPELWQSLTSPMHHATMPDAVNKTADLSQNTLAWALRQEKVSPREVGPNRGPWVRLYCNGTDASDGERHYWCASFASWCMRQGAEGTAILSQRQRFHFPVQGSASCDVLAERAQHAGIFLSAPVGILRKKIVPGSLFLVRRTDHDWHHAGIVEQAFDDHFTTVEGNTSPDGRSNGDGVYRRTRGYGPCDFVLLP